MWARAVISNVSPNGFLGLWHYLNRDEIVFAQVSTTTRPYADALLSNLRLYRLSLYVPQRLGMILTVQFRGTSF